MAAAAVLAVGVAEELDPVEDAVAVAELEEDEDDAEEATNLDCKWSQYIWTAFRATAALFANVLVETATYGIQSSAISRPSFRAELLCSRVVGSSGNAVGIDLLADEGWHRSGIVAETRLRVVLGALAVELGGGLTNVLACGTRHSRE